MGIFKGKGGSCGLDTEKTEGAGEIASFFFHVFIEQKIVMEERGWTAALFFPVSFQLERNAQSEYQERLMVPACCHLIVFRSAFRGVLFSLLLSAVT